MRRIQAIGPKVNGTMGPTELLYLECNPHWFRIQVNGTAPDKHGNRNRSILVNWPKPVAPVCYWIRSSYFKAYYKVNGVRCASCRSKEDLWDEDGEYYTLNDRHYCLDCIQEIDWVCPACLKQGQDPAYDDSEAPCIDCASGAADHYYED